MVMLSKRSWPLLLVPVGVFAGHGIACLIGALAGGGTGWWQAGVIGPLLCVAVPMAVAGFSRALLGGLRGEPTTRILRVLAPAQIVLFLGVEVMERTGEPSASRASWLLVGVGAQLVATLMLWAVTRMASAVGTRLRQRRQAFAPAPHAALGRKAVAAARTSAILGFESLCRRGPPPSIA